MYDKIGIIKKQIGSFDKIESNCDVPLQILDIITNQLDNLEIMKNPDYVYIPDIAIAWSDEEPSFTCDDICCAVEDVYSESCIYCDKIYKEWKVTDAFSSIINIFNASTILESIVKHNDEVNLITYVDRSDKLYGANDIATGIIVASSDSSMSFEGRGETYSVDISLENIKAAEIKLGRDRIVSRYMYVPSLLVEGNVGQRYDITLPSIGYKCMIEKMFVEGSTDLKPIGLSFYRVNDMVSIEEGVL